MKKLKRHIIQCDYCSKNIERLYINNTNFCSQQHHNLYIKGKPTRPCKRETKIKIGKANSIALRNKKQTDETIQKRIISRSIWWNSLSDKEKIQNMKQLHNEKVWTSNTRINNIAKSIKKLWKNLSVEDKETRVKNAAKCQKPNGREKELFNTVCELSSNYKLNTNGEILTIGGKIPDIVNVNGEKKLIEHFGKYWHGEYKTGRTRKQEEKLRKSFFKQFGWNSLIIWEEELKDKNLLKNKLMDFL